MRKVTLIDQGRDLEITHKQFFSWPAGLQKSSESHLCLSCLQLPWLLSLCPVSSRSLLPVKAKLFLPASVSYRPGLTNGVGEGGDNVPVNSGMASPPPYLDGKFPTIVSTIRDAGQPRRSFWSFRISWNLKRRSIIHLYQIVIYFNGSPSDSQS